MERINQYNTLVEMMAQARVLAALSDSPVVASAMDNIKLYVVNAVVDLGYSDATFNSDSIVRYRELIKD